MMNPPVKYIVVDPGLETGIIRATIWPDEFLVGINYSTTIDWNSTIVVLRDMAWEFMPLDTPAVMVIERAPHRADNIVQLGRVIDTIELAQELKEKYHQGLKVQIIAPGDWKPIAKAKNWRHSKTHTIHERDCLGMLMYSLIRDYGREFQYDH